MCAQETLREPQDLHIMRIDRTEVTSQELRSPLNVGALANCRPAQSMKQRLCERIITANGQTAPKTGKSNAYHLRHIFDSAGVPPFKTLSLKGETIQKLRLCK